MIEVHEFKNAEEIMEYLNDAKKQRSELDAAALPRQQALTIGDYFVQVIDFAGGTLTIYGEIKNPYLDDCEAPDPIEMEEEKEKWSQPHMKNMRFAKFFSRECPSGEYGHLHVATCGPLPKEAFERAKSLGWPDHNEMINEGG